MERLLEIMARLRDPEQGCPWDLQQDYASVVPHTLEEAYEVADAIERGDFDELRGELGDLLFQVAFYTQLAREEGRFDYVEVLDGICDKMIRRHPHVFGDAQYASAEQQREAWESIKASERGHTAEAPHSLMDGVTLALPAVLRAEKLQRRAARVGFDWPARGDVLDAVWEELDELTREIEVEAGGDADRIEDEFGDLLFTCVNLARHLKLDPERALRRANGKFERRFRALEQLAAAKGQALEGMDLDAMDGLWAEVKQREREIPGDSPGPNA